MLMVSPTQDNEKVIGRKDVKTVRLGTLYLAKGYSVLLSLSMRL